LGHEPTAASLYDVTIVVCNEIGDSSVDCQSYVTFVIGVVRTLGLSIDPNITWNEITLESTGEPITTGIVRKLVAARVLFRNARRHSLP